MDDFFSSMHMEIGNRKKCRLFSKWRVNIIQKSVIHPYEEETMRKTDFSHFLFEFSLYVNQGYFIMHKCLIWKDMKSLQLKHVIKFVVYICKCLILFCSRFYFILILISCFHLLVTFFLGILRNWLLNMIFYFFCLLNANINQREEETYWNFGFLCK